eukprot:m.345100 g.345100  ORF g.345100 m.345100 type:complete len:72 (-) comp16554_c0_seq1:2092-2307(-)
MAEPCLQKEGDSGEFAESARHFGPGVMGDGKRFGVAGARVVIDWPNPPQYQEGGCFAAVRVRGHALAQPVP